MTSYALTLLNYDRFSNLFHCLDQKNICNNTVIKDPATPPVCRYTTLWNVSVLKATVENKTTSVTTHLKKLTTGNKRVYCLSYYLKEMSHPTVFTWNVQCLAAERRTLKMCCYKSLLVFICCF